LWPSARPAKFDPGSLTLANPAHSPRRSGDEQHAEGMMPGAIELIEVVDELANSIAQGEIAGGVQSAGL
jgi:hypothetical protein